MGWERATDSQPRWPRSVRYAVALGATAVGTMLSVAVTSIAGSGSYVPLILAVAISAWFGGLAPALVATFCATLSVDFFVERPLYDLRVREPGTYLALIVFIVTAVSIAAIEERLRREIARAERARREAEEAGRMRDRLVAAATHDLKNPLSVISLRAQLLKREVALLPEEQGAPIRSGLDSIDTAAARLADLIETQIEEALLQAGQPIVLERRPVNLATLAREVAARLGQQTSHLRIVVESEAPDVIGQWDPERLERVLENLLGNAIKYSPHGGRITIRVTTARDADGDRAIVRVRDEGIGIPAAELPHIFEWFHRGSNAREGTTGSGVGLASAKRIVEEHGGTIYAESEQGRGSVFTMRLPLDP